MKCHGFDVDPINTEVSVDDYWEIIRLEKTIERLREALRKISNMTTKPDDKLNTFTLTMALTVARAALGEKE